MAPLAAIRLVPRVTTTAASQTTTTATHTGAASRAPASDPGLKLPPLTPTQPASVSVSPAPPPPRSAAADLRVFGVIDPHPAIPAELTRAMLQASSKSPTLRAMLVGTLREGYPFILGKPGAGTFTDANTVPKTIVVDPNALSDQGLLAQSLAHELGHIYENDLAQVYDPKWDRARYISENTVRALSGEADACMTELRVREEVIARGGTPAPISGLGDAKIALWQRHRAGEPGLASDDEIRHALALFIGKNEHPSTAAQTTYWEYYAQPFANGWDAANHGSRAQGLPPPP